MDNFVWHFSLFLKVSPFPQINIVAICTWIPSTKTGGESALEFSTPSGLHYAQSGSPHFELSP
jgi:hypothetical protein